jgi:integrase
VLKAVLNHAWREGKIASDDAWRRVAPFREAGAARVRYLERDECRRLVNASPEPLRAIVRGALLTGARYSELARMRVADFHRDSGTLMVRTSKTGKVCHIELTPEGLDFFKEITAGRAGSEFLFHRDGSRRANRISSARSPKPAAQQASPQPHHSTPCATHMPR